jgi:hypothetical protein
MRFGVTEKLYLTLPHHETSDSFYRHGFAAAGTYYTAAFNIFGEAPLGEKLTQKTIINERNTGFSEFAKSQTNPAHPPHCDRTQLILDGHLTPRDSPASKPRRIWFSLVSARLRRQSPGLTEAIWSMKPLGGDTEGFGEAAAASCRASGMVISAESGRRPQEPTGSVE